MTARLRAPFALLLTGTAVLGAAWLSRAQGVDEPPAVEPQAGYAEVARRLGDYVAVQMKDKGLPAVSLALVEDQQTVWARGFGEADPQDRRPATAATVYRVGSVSKLFTDLAIMRLVEQGRLDLDAPVTRYLPDFRPRDPFARPLTLRMLAAHRSGLAREPPVGNYFVADEPTLAETMRSLNRTELVYAPGTKSKYSNAGVAVLGYVLERTQGRPFADHLRHELLEPMGLRRTSFAPRDDLVRDLARAVMWTYDGRVFAAPTFELGMAPAGSMYSTVTDLGRFLSVLFAGGRAPGGQIVRPETLEAMWTPQFAESGARSGFGIGFGVARAGGRRIVGHNGAIYGFATSLLALPEEKLGVVAVTTRDSANAVLDRIGELALRLLLARKSGQPLPENPDPPAPVPRELARRLDGRYRSGDKTLDLTERDGRLFLTRSDHDLRLELRARDGALVTDDVLGSGLELRTGSQTVVLGPETYTRVAVSRPAPPPARWRGLIGEYGPDHEVLYVYEEQGRLHALIEWFTSYPLHEELRDVYQFPDRGLYAGERVIFSRDASGRATQVVAGNVTFARRAAGPDGQAVFRIRPLRPVADLRREAAAAQPPAETGEFRPPELVELTGLDPTIRLDVRYATRRNFLGTPVYTQARAFLQRPAAEALVRAHRALAALGFGLLVHDAYRPWSVTKVFWEATPPDKRLFVADPARGSRHNRGCAVDLTLYERATGRPVEMPGVYDEMTERSFPDYPGGSERQRWHRERLRDAMEEQGFTVFESEWWHFDCRDWRLYPILNLPFERLPGARRAAGKAAAA
jgi:CubicO group peptidase (beta-lactamase class C family)/D-alanyl-D-alanine dipeptidase